MGFSKGVTSGVEEIIQPLYILVFSLFILS